MGSKEKLSECLGYLAVALAQYVTEYGLPYPYTVNQVGDETITIQMTDYMYMHKVGHFFNVDYILSLKDPIEYLRTELVDMHNELSGGAE